LEDRRFRDYARSVASGATVLGFRPDDTKAYALAVPPIEVQTAFDEIEMPIAELQERMLEAAEDLESLRDLLLPKLVTGQIDVSDLDLDGLGDEAGV
jgi:type I restriction enzyme S subunit